jgi:hypothetical protein
MAESDRVDEKATPRKVSFHFSKSNFFRVIHVDGAWGGLDPRGQIQMTLYSERPGIPTDISHEVTETSNLGPEITTERVVRYEYVRELEAQVVMTVDTAKQVAAWLLQRVALADKRPMTAEEGDDDSETARH